MARQIRFLFALFALSLAVNTSLFWYFEQPLQSMLTYGDTVWWWLVTSTTVGYGDIVPITTGGRLAGLLTIIVGIFGYTHTISLILQSVQIRLEKEERGKGAVRHNHHLLICEYTAFADEMIQEMEEKNLFNKLPKVILTSLIERKPYKNYDFVYGVPISPTHLKRAGADRASKIFIFSNTRFTDPDIKTLHIASRIMKMNEHANIYIELQDKNHPLLENLPRKVHILETQALLDAALQHNYIEIERYL